MNKLTRNILVAAIGLFAMFTQAYAEKTGTPFSDFDGNPQTIESYAADGKWLVVMIWAHDCHVCNMEAESYAQFHLDNEDKKISVLGVSIDGQKNLEKAVDFLERHDIPFPSLIGEPEAVMLDYMKRTGSQFVGTPTIMIFNPSGKLMAAQAGAVPPEVIEKFIQSKSQ